MDNGECNRIALLSQEGSTIETAVEIVRGVVPEPDSLRMHSERFRLWNHPSRHRKERDDAALLTQEGSLSSTPPGFRNPWLALPATPPKLSNKSENRFLKLGPLCKSHTNCQPGFHDAQSKTTVEQRKCQPIQQVTTWNRFMGIDDSNKPNQRHDKGGYE